MPDKVSTRERYGEAFWRRRRHVVTQSVELVRPSNCSLLNNGYPVPPFWRQFANKVMIWWRYFGCAQSMAVQLPLIVPWDVGPVYALGKNEEDRL